MQIEHIPNKRWKAKIIPRNILPHWDPIQAIDAAFRHERDRSFPIPATQRRLLELNDSALGERQSDGVGRIISAGMVASAQTVACGKAIAAKDLRLA